MGASSQVTKNLKNVLDNAQKTINTKLNKRKKKGGASGPGNGQTKGKRKGAGRPRKVKKKGSSATGGQSRSHMRGGGLGGMTENGSATGGKSRRSQASKTNSKLAQENMGAGQFQRKGGEEVEKNIRSKHVSSKLSVDDIEKAKNNKAWHNLVANRGEGGSDPEDAEGDAEKQGEGDDGEEDRSGINMNYDVEPSDDEGGGAGGDNDDDDDEY